MIAAAAVADEAAALLICVPVMPVDCPATRPFSNPKLNATRSEQVATILAALQSTNLSITGPQDRGSGHYGRLVSRRSHRGGSDEPELGTRWALRDGSADRRRRAGLRWPGAEPWNTLGHDHQCACGIGGEFCRSDLVGGGLKYFRSNPRFGRARCVSVRGGGKSGVPRNQLRHPAARASGRNFMAHLLTGRAGREGSGEIGQELRGRRDQSPRGCGARRSMGSS